MGSKLPASKQKVTMDIPIEIRQCLDNIPGGKSLGTKILVLLKQHFSAEIRANHDYKTVFKEAPLDKYLPIGADPFAPIGVEEPLVNSLSFDRIQARSKNAPLPRIFRHK